MSAQTEVTAKTGRTRGLWWWLLGTVVVLLFAAYLAITRVPLTLADLQVREQLWAAGARSRYVVVDGRRVHYFDDPASVGAPGDGRVLLLVHGLGARSEEWAPLMPLLTRAGFHVYAPDLLGYGRSAKPDIAYSIDDQEKLMVGFLRAVGVRRADVAGWSMGGWVAMELAADDPELVDRLVLYDSAGTYFDLHGAVDLFLPQDTAGVTRLFGRLTPHPPKLPPYVMRDLLRRMKAGEWVRARNLDAMMTGRDLMDFRLGEIREPTLVMWGTEDRLIPESTGERLAAGLPDGRFVPVPGCGHLAPAQCAPVVARSTIAFLSGAVAAPDGVRTPAQGSSRSPAVLAPH